MGKVKKGVPIYEFQVEGESLFFKGFRVQMVTRKAFKLKDMRTIDFLRNKKPCSREATTITIKEPLYWIPPKKEEPKYQQISNGWIYEASGLYLEWLEYLGTKEAISNWVREELSTPDKSDLKKVMKGLMQKGLFLSNTISQSKRLEK